MIEKLNEIYRNYLAYPDNRSENGKLLSGALVNCVNHLWEAVHRNTLFPMQKEKKPEIPQLPDEEFIPIMDFIEEYRIIVDGKKRIIATDGAISAVLRRLLLTDNESLAKFATQEVEGKGRWFLKPKHFIHYISQSKDFPRFRKRCRQWLAENEVKNGNNTKVLSIGESLQTGLGS